VYIFIVALPDHQIVDESSLKDLSIVMVKEKAKFSVKPVGSKAKVRAM
jgi:hypothetical protein